MKNFFIAVFLLTTLLAGQNIELKEKQLENLKSQIEKTRKNLEKTGKRKLKARKSTKQYKSKINSNEKKIIRIRNSELKSKKQLEKTKDKILATDFKLENIRELCTKEFQKLMILEIQKKQRFNTGIDCTVLAELIHLTIDKYNEETDKKYSLRKEKKRQEKAWKDAQWTRIVTAKKNRKYKKKMSDLNNQIEKLSKLEKQYLKEKKQLEQNSKELADLIANLKLNYTEEFEDAYKFSSEKLDWPLTGKIIRDYGKYSNSNYRISLENNGINIEAQDGQPVKAVDEGIVAFAGRFKAFGKLIIIDHQNGFHSVYAHNSRLLVTKGNKIKKNQKIALAGSSGSAETPQLHFEMRKKGKSVDPKPYLKKKQ
ncbi:MAG: hypothetical protein CSB55_02235 [Candidatus Cloacimonadota bacterium]|nr:MAG: hypothetical protein CSB55_02235 [Candidatus Cloacimonadota bacterium]